jgi:hypothetical protein
MSHSTQLGFNEPVIRVSVESCPVWISRANSPFAGTQDKSPVVGVGHVSRCAWFTARPNSFPDGPGRRLLTGTIPCGVGHEPDPVSTVRGANGRSRYAIPFRVIPARGQVSENSPESSSKESWDVLHDDVSGSKFANESSVLGPKTRACPVDPCSLACVGEVLAGEAAAEDVDVWHRHGQYFPRSSAFTTTVKLVGVSRGPPTILAFIAICASNVFPSS